MKSNVLQFTSEEAFTKGILEETEKCAIYNKLDKKSSLRLILLAEELTGMIPNMAEGFSGKFWLENDGTAYELHTVIRCDNVDYDMQEKFLSVSKSGKNAAARGIVGKIRSAIYLMMTPDPNAPANIGCFYHMEEGLSASSAFAYSWSLDNYILNVRDKIQDNEWDEYEKSIIVKLADDVIVGVMGREVSIIVKKNF